MWCHNSREGVKTHKLHSPSRVCRLSAASRIAALWTSLKRPPKQKLSKWYACCKGTHIHKHIHTQTDWSLACLWKQQKRRHLVALPCYQWLLTTNRPRRMSWELIRHGQEMPSCLAPATTDLQPVFVAVYIILLFCPELHRAVLLIQCCQFTPSYQYVTVIMCIVLSKSRGIFGSNSLI